MKKKPVIILVSIVLLAVCAFIFIQSKYLRKPEKQEVTTFLDRFKADLQKGDVDTLLNYFEDTHDTRQLKKLLGMVDGKTSFNGKGKPLFKVDFGIEDSDIRVINTELTEVTVPIYFTDDGKDPKGTSLSFKLRKIAGSNFKIIQVDARLFVTDFLTYENGIKTRDLPAADIYSPMTLAAFKTAEKLKTKYDSVIWFAHMDKQIFYYVIKGKWEINFNDPYKEVARDYRMGLVGPDLTEVIPPGYDMIHNISGTFAGMVEVEKDNKKGFFRLDGKNMVPVVYDQIFPITDDENLAVLKNGAGYFYLKKDWSITEKVDLKLVDFFSKIKNTSADFTLNDKSSPVITECNSYQEHGSVYVAPSYLVYLNLAPHITSFKNPLRKLEFEEVHKKYDVSLISRQDSVENNWLSATFYSIKDYFLGGRSELYNKKNIVILDKKNDRILAHDIITGYSEESEGTYGGKCTLNSIKPINDSLFEVRAGAELFHPLYDSTKTLAGGIYYHYLAIKDDKLQELPDVRVFGFTKYVKMDDSYLNGCYEIQTGDWSENDKKNVVNITPEMLRYMKNEIYADYRYQFKDKRWQRVFEEFQLNYDAATGKPKPYNANVDDSLTVIDKYNINFINQKLKGQKAPSLASVK